MWHGLFALCEQPTFLCASSGETFAQRSGVLNLGVEGVMLMGVYSTFFVALTTGSLWGGIAAALLVGALLGLLIALVRVMFRADQGISGISLFLFGAGLSSLVYGAFLLVPVAAWVLNRTTWGLNIRAVGVPSDLAVMLPYVLTIVVLALGTWRARGPSALNKPFASARAKRATALLGLHAICCV